ncbi:MAG: glycosyltransferase family 4 protein [Pseudomonadota bacterium]
MEVIIVAENASARFGGEAILPLHYFTKLKKRGFPVLMIVHERVRNELAQDFPDLLHGVRFVSDSLLQKLLSRLGRGLPARVRESTTDWMITVLTAVRQRRIVKNLIGSGFGDVIHQPTPVSPKLPSFMYGFGKPVVIGPMNGGMEYPPAFKLHESFPTRLFVRFGRAAANAVNFLIPGKRQAALLLCANERTEAALPKGASRNRKQLVENGVDMALWSGDSAPGSIPTRTPVPTFLFMGRLVGWKSVDILIEALARVVRQTPVELKIVGAGPEMARLQTLATSLKVAQYVEFLGFLPQSECVKHVRTARALVLPSLYECGGAVVLEAMCASRPVIASDWGGPRDYLDTSSGFLVVPESREYMIEAFASKMLLLALDADLANQMGSAARLRAQMFFTWESKIDSIVECYESVVASVTKNF